MPASNTSRPAGLETPAEEIAQLRVRVSQLRLKRFIEHRARAPRLGGGALSWGDALVNRFNFVADRCDTVEGLPGTRTEGDRVAARSLRTHASRMPDEVLAARG
jgi:hypothetical protein